MQAVITETLPAARFSCFRKGRRIGRDPSYPCLVKQRLGIDPARMARLDCHRPRVILSQSVDKRSGTGRFVIQRRRQLHQQAAEFLTQVAALVQKLFEQAFALKQTPFMGDLLGDLDAETKPVRHAFGPLRIGRGSVGAIERTVDLHAGQTTRVTL